jgi:ferric-dicitrate binding protein FerR (iron transport regulator)
MISLDDTRLITMEANSRGEVKSAGKAMEFELTEGKLFFNVTEKLKSKNTNDERVQLWYRIY